MQVFQATVITLYAALFGSVLLGVGLGGIRVFWNASRVE